MPWLQDTADNKSIINAILDIEGEPDIKVVRQGFEDRVLSYRAADGTRIFDKFEKYADTAFGAYVWKYEEHFDLADHIFMYEDSRPRTDVELHQVVNDLNQPQLPVKKSPWQLIIIPTAMESAQSSYTMMLRGHHSLGDGISHMRLMIEHLFDKSDDNHERPLPRGRYGPTKSIWTLLGAIFYGPYVAVAQLLRHADRNELHGPEMTGVKIMAWSPPINLASVKQVKNACGATVNDVLTACLTGAFRDTFMDRSPSNQEFCCLADQEFIRVYERPDVANDVFYCLQLYQPASLCDEYASFGASIISYRGEVRVGVRCDTAVLDNPAFVCDKFLKHFGHLVEQAKAMA
ncbi:PREDICTED: probable diacyglycerol O-acyltransferase tgs1 [Priapulus caudatus]|uniref:diacylglycerol O-acyltransferase n=1 Tax=Priapulus caudatus TaxID=37621 RepID=A0ABM1EP64_PRICU|nr:PREDICTED: probable diacyglycerol O-acyltransferase tgs1 [Priapulus caudatus]